ncbi:MAG: CoA transferase, partial [Chloroflexota bacterium]
RVLDLADAIGVYCTKLLADLGADVIKIEPTEGSRGRLRAPFYHDEVDPDRSLWWFFFNTNKRSVTLDLGTGEGRRLFARLAAGASVIVEDAEPGFMESIGLGYQALSHSNPGLVFTSVTPYGQTGPYSGHKGSDLTAQAMAGLIYRIGWPDEPPNSVAGFQAYNQAGTHAAVATLSALFHADLTGKGQQVDVSMHEAVSIINYDAIPRYTLQKEIQKRAGPGVGSTGLRGQRIWRCQDGYVRFQLVGGPAALEWPRLVAWLGNYGMADELGEERWNDPHYRAANLDELEGVVSRFFETKPARALMEEGQERRVMTMTVSTVEDLFVDPQLTEEGFFTPVNHPGLEDELIYPGGPYRLSETPWRIRRPAPRLGEHNSEVFQGELGLSQEELLRLRETKVV